MEKHSSFPEINQDHALNVCILNSGMLMPLLAKNRISMYEQEAPAPLYCDLKDPHGRGINDLNIFYIMLTNERKRINWHLGIVDQAHGIYLS
jgi:hypothetical protein